MFTKTKAMFLYCTSPVHMGAGTAVGGLIDNPIQRERHTDHPVVAGSGLKGAVRHAFYSQLRGGGEEQKLSKQVLRRIFGPETSASDFAGAVSFSDAQVVAFPVRSPTCAYVYATCPTVLARAHRLIEQAGITPDWNPGDSLKSSECRIASRKMLSPKSDLVLEALSLKPSGVDENLRSVATWLGNQALPTKYEFFRNKIKTDLVLLSDEVFGYFVRNATVVEPHVRIHTVSGTASDGGLFYTENLPPETLMVALLMASDERTSAEQRGDSHRIHAEEVIDTIARGREAFNGIDGQVIQIGGDATTGRGLVSVRLVDQEKEAQ